MPIIRQPTQLLIFHRLVGNSPTILTLGEMSTEMAIFLEARLMQHQYENSGDNESLRGLDQFLLKPDMRDIIARSITAGNRSYKPPLCSQYGKITDIGLDLAKTARLVLSEINSSDPQGSTNLAYSPQRWTKADDIILNGHIAIRALRLLDLLIDVVTKTEANHAVQMMHNLTQDVQTQLSIAKEAGNQQNQASGLSNPNEQNNVNLDGFAVGGRSPENGQITTDSTDNTDDQKPETMDRYRRNQEDLPEAGKIIEFHEMRPSADINPNIVEPTMFQLGSNWQAFVPMRTFGPQARNDVTQLVKYGLLDFKAHVTPGRGRPKFVIRPSIRGQVFMSDVNGQGLL